MRRRGDQGRHRDDELARGKTARGKPRTFRPFRTHAARMPRRPGIFQGKASGAGAASHEIPGQPLQPRAQPQGGAGRAARPAGDPVDQPRVRPRKFLGAVGETRIDHRRGGAPGAAALQAAAGPARAPALRRGAPRGPPAVRLPGEPGARPGLFRHRPAGEQLMQAYFRTAKAVTQLNTILLQNLGTQIFPVRNSDTRTINERFRRAGELLEACPPDLFEREPSAILESFLIMQQHPELKGMTAQTLRGLWRAGARIGAAFRRDPRNRATFLALLQQPRGIVHELRRMNQYGILGRYLPAFRRIVGQMQHDLFHVYTVDQHILSVVRNLRRFTMLEFAHEYPLCSRLIAGLERHWLLYIAAIFHDIAKGRGGDHSQLGRLEARRFCRAHGLQPEDAKLVEFLVEHHLTMSSVAQKQDLSDPEVVRRFADTVGTERRLAALYLFTVADIRGTSPKVWNAWKGKLLEDLFRATQYLLKGGKIEADQYIQSKQDEAKRLLRLYGLSNTVQDPLWRHLDVPYFLRHDPQEIAWHTRLLHYRSDTDKPVVKARLSPAGEGLQVVIYVPDQRELFARICGYFGSIGFGIVDAKIYTTRHGYALDTFQVMDLGSIAHPRDMIAEVEKELADWLVKQVPLPKPVQGRVSRRVKHFPIAPEVRIVPDEKGQYHSLSVTAGDRPGLLYAIALVLSRYGVTLHTAKIATLGERAEDVFVVSGAALANSKTVLQLETDLLQALQA